MGTDVDLDHHGDIEAAPGLTDFAVNVHGSRPPDWLLAALHQAVEDVGRYPLATPAREALAGLHGVPPECVLVTAGAAEVFTLVAGLPWRRPVVVHPQFTEPEAALAAQGHRVERVILSADNGFRLAGATVPADADLVVIGNPTNPTSRLHSAAEVEALLARGRTLVVDEAFMDAVEAPSEPVHSILRRAATTPGLLAVRSLTKTFAVPGLRVGYAVGTPDLLARLAARQPHWAVGILAVTAAVACAGELGQAHAAAYRAALPAQRGHLAAALRSVGLEVVEPPEGPFVLARHPEAARLRQTLRRNRIAVRRGDTFPGLGSQWLRFAVRDQATVDRLTDVLRDATAAVEASA